MQTNYIYKDYFSQIKSLNKVFTVSIFAMKESGNISL